ncbi:MAG: hypothetical protein AB8B52_00855 [Winogradskyella sp.]|uniref:hypothetical protein n=1 Tax=Winogradskyella sp. TaxID=1883156 RepID=UPI00385E1D44
MIQTLIKDSNITYNIHTDNAGNGKKSKLLVISKKEKPLYIVNNKIISENDASFIGMNAETIKTVNVLKGKSATDKYGEKGKNGVIIITSKTDEELDEESKTKHTEHTKSNKTKISSNDDVLITIGALKQNKDLPYFTEPNKKFLILVDGKEISKAAMHTINPKQIKGMSVLRGEDAVKTYGEKGKNGVIKITMKNGEARNIALETEQIETLKAEISSISFTDDDESKNASLAYISKYSTDKVLENHKLNLAKIGITVKYSKLKRNRKGEITSIKISLRTDTGSQSIANWKSNSGIPNIEYGKSEGSLIARTK